MGLRDDQTVCRQDGFKGLKPPDSSVASLLQNDRVVPSHLRKPAHGVNQSRWGSIERGVVANRPASTGRTTPEIHLASSLSKKVAA